MRWPPPNTLLLTFLLCAAGALGAPLKPSDSVGIISHIRRKAVASTALTTVGYSKRLHTLEIEFRNGAIYRYLDVEPSVYEKLLSAPSKARFYDDNIRRKYRSVHVRPRSP